MSDKKISELTELTAPDGAEEFVVNDSGTSKKIKMSNLMVGIDDNATSTQLTVSDISVDVTGYVTCDNKTVIEGVDTGNPINTVTDSLRVSGYGIQANRGAMFLTNAATDGLIHMGNSGAHNSNILASFTSNGLTFNGDTAAANALDDYEEGTWTPGFAFGGGVVGVTYNSQVAKYTKIGDMVTASGYIALTSKGTSVGAATVTGLPFASQNLSNLNTNATLWLSAISYADTPQGYNAKNKTTIALSEVNNAGTVSTLTDANFINGSGIMINITYRV
jgi:hypothetical protein